MKLKLISFNFCVRLVIVLGMFMTVTVYGQPSKGLTFDDQEYSKVKSKSPAQSFSNTNTEPIYSMRSYCPTPGNQGKNGSCVGWATAFGAFTASVAQIKQVKDKAIITKDAYSPMFVYNLIKASDCSGGARMTPAFELLRDKGVCRLSEFNPADCSTLPDSLQLLAARANRIKSYQSLFPIDAAADAKIVATIKELSRNRPVVIGMMLTPSFDTIGKGGLWRPKPGEQITGGHAMVVVGYDEINNRFELMNSWGTSFGDNGFAYVSFADYAKYCRYAFSMILDDSKVGDPFVYQGSFYLDKIVGYDPETKKYSYEKLDGYRDGEYYLLKEGQLKMRNYFKIMATEMKNGNALYIFSIKPDGSGELLFPTKHQDTYGISLVDNPIILEVDSYVQLPEGNKSYIADLPGDDSLIFLFSKLEIPDPDNVVRRVANASGGLMDRLRMVLGDQLVTSTDVNYTKNKIQFSGSSTKGTIVPIVLKATINP
jgi:hypothetical protein